MSQPSKEYKRKWAAQKYRSNPAAARAKLAAWRAKNPERVLAQRKRSYWKNKPKRLAATQAWRELNHEKILAQARRWRKANPEKCRDNARRHYHRHKPRYFANAARWGKKQILLLSDPYVRRKLSRNSPVNWRAWPAALVECKRAQIKLQRLTKTYGSTT